MPRFCFDSAYMTFLTCGHSGTDFNPLGYVRIFSEVMMAILNKTPLLSKNAPVHRNKNTRYEPGRRWASDCRRN